YWSCPCRRRRGSAVRHHRDTPPRAARRLAFCTCPRPPCADYTVYASSYRIPARSASWRHAVTAACPDRTTTLDRIYGLLRFALPHEHSGTTANAIGRCAARHAPRHREGEPARAARRQPGADAAPASTRLRADAPAYHYGFFGIAARADHRRARERRGVPGGAHAHPP